MGLTGLPLLVISIIVSLSAVAGTVWFWRGGEWWRPVARTVAILVCEALVLFTTGLAVNRALDIFPSWSTLFHQHRAAPPPTAVADPATRLDDWLRGRTLEGARNGLVFEWRPGGAATWHLSTAPFVYVPPRYFTAKAARFPVVLLVAPAQAGPAQGGWDPHKVSVLVRRADRDVDPAVLVFLRTDHPDDMLIRKLPEQLDEDLRTSARGWAVVGVGPAAPLAFDALPRDPLRFWAAVAVSETPGGLPKGLATIRADLDGQDTLTIVGGPPSAARSGVDVVARPEDRVPHALQWAYRHMPAPLAAPITQPIDPAAPR